MRAIKAALERSIGTALERSIGTALERTIGYEIKKYQSKQQSFFEYLLKLRDTELIADLVYKDSSHFAPVTFRMQGRNCFRTRSCCRSLAS